MFIIGTAKFIALRSEVLIARVEKFHHSLFSDLAQVWHCPDWLVWKFWSGSDLALVSIPLQKRLYVSNESFFF